MNYSEATQWLFDQLPMYQQKGAVALNAKLDGITHFCAYLGEPHQKFKSIHVAGTNGKGSSSHMLAAILQEAGYKVGLYTSPHLKDFRERIKINGLEISEDEVVSFVLNHKDYMSQNALSFFEMTVAMAFDYFASAEVDIAIIEVGLGGRLDATNIIKPEVSLITNIGFDHMDLLGNTLAQIAIEKAGIIKNNIPVVIGEQQSEVKSVFLKKIKDCNAKIYFASDDQQEYTSDLLGDYQKSNTKTAVAAIRLLKGFTITQKHISDGLLFVVKNTNLKGRWQILQEHPKVICDTAHNAEGLKIVLNQLKKEKTKKLHIVLGVVSDKKLEDILPMFPTEASYYFCKPNIPRGLSEVVLQEKAADFNLVGKKYLSVKKAYKSALLNANQEDTIYIGGSTFVVAEII